MSFSILTAASGNTTASLLTTLLPFVVLIVVFYFLLIRPENKKKKALSEMRDSLSVGVKSPPLAVSWARLSTSRTIW